MKKLCEIFDYWYGVNLELINCIEDKNGIPFVSRTSKNNGVVAKVKIIDSVNPNPAKTLSLAGGGSVLSCFYQDTPYYSGRDLFILSPKEYMSKEMMILYSYVISLNAYKYNYGRQANSTFKDLTLPEPHEISYLLDVPITSNFKFNPAPVIHSDFLFSEIKWKWFKIKDIFHIEKCKCSNATELLEDGIDIPYVGAKKNENGIMKYVKYNANLITKGNCIVFIGDGQGSVGYSLYQPYDFIGSTTLLAGYNENLNVYNALFIVTILDLERYRYSFGRKYNKSVVQNTKIKLPINLEGKPDWVFMENYIKSLPFSSNL